MSRRMKIVRSSKKRSGQCLDQRHANREFPETETKECVLAKEKAPPGTLKEWNLPIPILSLQKKDNWKERVPGKEKGGEGWGGKGIQGHCRFRKVKMFLNS